MRSKAKPAVAYDLVADPASHLECGGDAARASPDTRRPPSTPEPNARWRFRIGAPTLREPNPRRSVTPATRPIQVSRHVPERSAGLAGQSITGSGPAPDRSPSCAVNGVWSRQGSTGCSAAAYGEWPCARPRFEPHCSRPATPFRCSDSAPGTWPRTLAAVTTRSAR